MAVAATARGCGCGKANSRSWPTSSASTSWSATCPPYQQVEQNRTPALLLHQPELARQAARQLPSHRRIDLGAHYQDRPHGALRTRHWPIPQRHCRLGCRDGRHQHQTRRVPRRVELHHLTKHSSAKPRAYFVTYPKHRSSPATTVVGRGPPLFGRLFDGGTDGSNPSSSSEESANHQFLSGGAYHCGRHKCRRVVSVA